MRNFVAKNIKRCGSGVHKDKYAKHKSRARIKHLSHMEV